MDEDLEQSYQYEYEKVEKAELIERLKAAYNLIRELRAELEKWV
ncbi:MAG: hypothetical protein PHX80_04055 [Candidatus Nanoarchaeia archaeon]|nr:hypothetical protein [Candidatus Nanoarchaeia archaeon]